MQLPRLGLGVFRAPSGETTRQAVLAALHAGYRHVDTATIYGNEQDVGEAIRRSSMRSEIFVTTKLWNADQGFDQALRGFDASLKKPGLSYVDLYLLLVLEIRVPHIGAHGSLSELASALWAMVPKFVSWVISFLTVRVIWLNPHRLFKMMSRIDNGLFWWSANLLLWTSFIPFPTALMGDYPQNRLAVSFYGGVMRQREQGGGGKGMLAGSPSGASASRGTWQVSVGLRLKVGTLVGLSSRREVVTYRSSRRRTARRARRPARASLERCGRGFACGYLARARGTLGPRERSRGVAASLDAGA